MILKTAELILGTMGWRNFRKNCNYPGGITVTKYLVRLGGCRSWPQGFVANKQVDTYNVGGEIFNVWTSNSDMKNS